MADKKYEINFKMTDGTTQSVQFTAPQGSAGSDASVTATNIKTALGYTPANADDVSGLSEQIVDETTIQNMIDTKFNSIVNGNEVAY